MASCRRVLVGSCLPLFVYLTAILAGPAAAFASQVAGVAITHHDLFVQIDPGDHAIVVQDRITLEVPQSQAIRLSLAPTLIVDRVILTSGDRLVDDPARDIPFEIEHGSSAQPTQHITIPAAAVSAGTASLVLSYHGLINDPPREPRHLRFVTPSETSGHIGSEGVYLSSETQWYPDLPGSLSTYRLQVALPEGWTAVTQGKPRATLPCPAERCRRSGFFSTDWDSTQPSEALTLVANRFVAKTRDWTASTGQSIQLAAYLFPEDARFADEYLDATARYLDAYIPLLGPYPFDTFAVVENFFASGLGMPSFTLLGSGIIKRHYVQPYALGHEIVHSWIGNSVFNRIDRGNWVEGLTTYLANYYWHELSGDLAQARDQRRLLVRGYNLHVPLERDYPVGQFTQKQDERDNAIGYQKAAMVFHLLRQEVGDEMFWSALKRLVVLYRGRHAEWHDVERTFTETSGRDLRWFFAQWIEQDGAPSLTVTSAVAHLSAGDATQAFQLDVTIAQAGRLFQVPIQLRADLEDGKQQVWSSRISRAMERISITLPVRPTRIVLDPDAMLLRRISRRALPPSLNHYVTDRRRSVIQGFASGPSEPHPFRDVVTRIETQDAQKPLTERAMIASLDEHALLPKEGSVLLLGSPDSRPVLDAMMRSHCGERLTLREAGVTVNGSAYEGAGTAVLVSCHRSDELDSVVTLVYAVTPQAASSVARLLFFYGWNSYVVFKDGAVVTRGEWAAAADQMEVSVDETSVVR